MNSTILRKIIWVLTAAAMILIFWLSSRPVEVSRQDSAWVMETLNMAETQDEATDTSNASMMSIQMMVRKQAHVIMYFGLAGLIYLSIYGYAGKCVRTGIAAWVLTIIYAGTDEIHQIFSHRGAQFSDILIDARGAVAAVAIASVIFFIIEKNQKIFGFVNRFYNLTGMGDDGKLSPYVRHSLYGFRMKR